MTELTFSVTHFTGGLSVGLACLLTVWLTSKVFQAFKAIAQ